MIDRRFLEHIYQQWSHGTNDYAHRWIDFVEMAAKTTGTSADQIMKELQKCTWFIKGD